MVEGHRLDCSLSLERHPLPDALPCMLIVIGILVATRWPMGLPRAINPQRLLSVWFIRFSFSGIWLCRWNRISRFILQGLFSEHQGLITVCKLLGVEPPDLHGMRTDAAPCAPAAEADDEAFALALQAELNAAPGRPHRRTTAAPPDRASSRLRSGARGGGVPSAPPPRAGMRTTRASAAAAGGGGGGGNAHVNGAAYDTDVRALHVMQGWS